MARSLDNPLFSKVQKKLEETSISNNTETITPASNNTTTNSNIDSSTPTNEGANILTSTSTSTVAKIITIEGSNPETETRINTNTITETILSTNISTNTITIEKRLKYSEERLHRAYYLKKEIVKKVDKLSKKFNLDKSDIVNEALELFFNSIGKQI